MRVEGFYPLKAVRCHDAEKQKNTKKGSLLNVRRLKEQFYSRHSVLTLELGKPTVRRHATQLRLNAQQAVVFGHPVGAAQ